MCYLENDLFSKRFTNQLQSQGKAFDDKPAGTEIPGKPAILTGTVKISLRYIATASFFIFSSAIPKAGVGVAGVRIASMPESKH